MPKKRNLNHDNGQSEEQNQWVTFLPDSCASHGDTTFCKLRHPKTDEQCMFLFSPGNKRIYEVLNFNEEHRSWFIGDTVQSDGSLYIPSPFDPVLIALPYLIKAAEKGNFMKLEQIIEDSDYPECHRLCSCDGMEDIEEICDVKGVDDCKVYRYNKEKALQWLEQKINKLVSILKEKKIQTSSSCSHVSTYVISSRNTTASPDDILRFAHGIMSEYLPCTLAKEFQEHLGIKEENIHEKPEMTEPKSKRMKSDISPIEDYSKQMGEKTEKSKTTRLTVAQKKLEKVDKKGMKSISSFFTPSKK